MSTKVDMEFYWVGCWRIYKLYIFFSLFIWFLGDIAFSKCSVAWRLISFKHISAMNRCQLIVFSFYVNTEQHICRSPVWCCIYCAWGSKLTVKTTTSLGKNCNTLQSIAVNTLFITLIVEVYTQMKLLHITIYIKSIVCTTI